MKKYITYTTLLFILIWQSCSNPEKDIIGDWEMTKMVSYEGSTLDTVEFESTGQSPCLISYYTDGRTGFRKQFVAKGKDVRSISSKITLWYIKNEGEGKYSVNETLEKGNPVKMHIKFLSSSEFVEYGDYGDFYYKKVK